MITGVVRETGVRMGAPYDVPEKGALFVLLAMLGCGLGASRAHTSTDRVYAATGMVRRAYVDSTRRAWGGAEPRPLVTLVWGTRATRPRPRRR